MITRVKSVFFLLAIMATACSPKISELAEEDVVTETVQEENVKSEPVNPCATFDDLPGYERGQAETAFVLYRDYMKAENYQEALNQWKIAYSTAPGSNGRVKYHFDDGVKIYKYFYDNTQDETLQRAYVDTVLMILDKRKECFGDEAYVNGLKGFNLYYYFSRHAGSMDIYKMLKSNIDVKGKNADYFVINPFTKLLYDGVMSGDISYEEGRKYAKLILQNIENGKATCKGQICDAWAVIEEYAPDRLESLEALDDFYDCAYYTDKYFTLYKQYPDSCDIINLAYSRMVRAQCNPQGQELTELKSKKNTTCYVAPPPLSCAAQGAEHYNNGQYKKAVDSYLMCVENSTNDDTKAQYLLLVAKIYYRDLKNYPQSRKYALEAAGMKAGWGEPFMLIGNLYASSGPLCGTGRGWDSQVVTWPAIDMWTRAKNVDPSVAREANALINKYKTYMPTKEDVFFRTELRVGGDYFVPCWIQENTKIRTSD
jgi:hypothetical protein